MHTAHLMQACWYTELLERTVGQSVSSAFFLLGSGERADVDLGTVREDYLRCRRELAALRDGAPAPGPHLSATCPSCDWRGHCMPRLVASRHLSLLPNLTRSQVARLRALGVTGWPDVETASDALLLDLGLAPFELTLLRSALTRLQAGRPPLRLPLRPDAFSGLTPVALEFADLAQRRRAGEELRPVAIHYQRGMLLDAIRLPPAGEGPSASDLSPLGGGSGLIAYGGTDASALRRLLRESGLRPVPPVTDLLGVFERYVHFPLLGLDLGTLLLHIAGGRGEPSPLDGPARVRATRQLMNWVL